MREMCPRLFPIFQTGRMSRVLAKCRSSFRSLVFPCPTVSTCLPVNCSLDAIPQELETVECKAAYQALHSQDEALDSEAAKEATACFISFTPPE